jgi:hypothetical protein
VKSLKHDLVYWLPRALCVAFAAFLGVFALDVFMMEGMTPLQTAGALALHLLPSLALLGVLAVTWSHEWIGAALFPALAIGHLVMAWGRLRPAAHLAVELPMLVIGALFLANWRMRRHEEEHPEATHRPAGA